MEENEIIEENPIVTDELQKTIDTTLIKLRERNPKTRIHAIAVKGDPDYDDKNVYVGYFCEPSIKTFSKYMSFLSNNQQVPGMRALATDCFLEGDRELIDDESLFLFGLMGQLTKLIEMRHGQLVNLSAARK